MLNVNAKRLLLKALATQPALYSLFRKTNLVRFLPPNKITDYIGRILRNRVKDERKTVFIDIGCNIGTASEKFLEVLRTETHIGIDANEDVLAQFSSKFPRAEPQLAAVSNRNGATTFFLDPATDGESPHNGSSMTRVGDDWRSIEVSVIDFAELIEPHLDSNLVIKMDIEGAEISALQSALDRDLDLSNLVLFLEEHRGLIKSDEYDLDLAKVVSGLERSGAIVAFWM